MADPVFFSDIAFDFSLDANGDLKTVSNKDSVNQSIRMIFETPKGLRPGSGTFVQNYGTFIKRYLFKKLDANVINMLVDEIIEAFSRYERRVELVNVHTDYDEPSKSLKIDISYRIFNGAVDEINTFTKYLEIQ